MTVTALQALERLFAALEARDEQAIRESFTDDAVFVDPHYPEVEMRGRAAIERGLAWGLESMEQFGFTIERSLVSDDGSYASVEVDTHHRLKGGRELRFPQAFFAEVETGKLSALRAFEPYRPNGVGGLFLRLSHLRTKLAWRRADT